MIIVLVDGLTHLMVVILPLSIWTSSNPYFSKSQRTFYSAASQTSSSSPSSLFQPPTYRTAMDELSPFIWRLGGSLQDYITYEEPGTDLVCPPMTSAPDITFKFTGGCLKQQRWHDLATLAKEKELQLVFGLNELRGRTHVQDKQWTGE